MSDSAALFLSRHCTFVNTVRGRLTGLSLTSRRTVNVLAPHAAHSMSIADFNPLNIRSRNKLDYVDPQYTNTGQQCVWSCTTCAIPAGENADVFDVAISIVVHFGSSIIARLRCTRRIRSPDVAEHRTTMKVSGRRDFFRFRI